MSVRVAGDGLGWSASKVSRIETCDRGAAPDDVSKMLDFYGVGPADRATFMSMARDAERTGWWTAYSGVMPGDYVALESEAAVVRTYAQHLIPGLLQTPEYVRALLRAYWPPVSPEEADTKIMVRLARQALLTRDRPVRLDVVLDEAVLYRPVGGPAVMRAQLRRLLDVSDLPNVRIRILPCVIGAHPGMEGGFVVLDFEDPLDPDIVYLENRVSDLYMDEPRDNEVYAAVFDRLATLSLDVEDTRRLITMAGEDDAMHLVWQRSGRSGGGTGSDCVEVSFSVVDRGLVPVRDSKDPVPTLAIGPGGWQAFVDGVRAGEFATQIVT